MSSFGFVFIRSEESDYIFTATDSVAVINNKIEIEGKEYPERYASLTSKTLHIPHVKSIISVAGTGYLSMWLHAFIDEARALTGFDDVCKIITLFFYDHYKDLAKDIKFECDKFNPDFMGTVVISGVSRYKNIMDDISLRERPLLMTRKFMVYKNRVVDGGWVNSESLDYNGYNIMDCCVPRLSDEIHEKVDKMAAPIMEKDFYTGSLFTLKNWLIETNKMYLESNRTGIVSAGEIHATILSLGKDDKYGETFTVSNMMLHRFDDFEEVLKEIRQKDVANN